MLQRGASGWMTLRSPRIGCGPLPWLGGAGPIFAAVDHGDSGLPGLGFLLLIMAGPVLGMALGMRHAAGEIFVILASQLHRHPVFLTRMMPFDFRGDLEQMDWLKSLPLSSWAIAAGELWRG